MRVDTRSNGGATGTTGVAGAVGAAGAAGTAGATGFSPTREGTDEMQGFGTCRSQSAQIYVDYEQDAPVARCREPRAVSPMSSSASVDHTPVGAQVRRRDSNPCNPHRVSS